MTPEAIHIRDGRVSGTSVHSQLSGTPPDGTYYRVDAPTLHAENKRLREVGAEALEALRLARTGATPGMGVIDRLAAALSEGGAM